MELIEKKKIVAEWMGWEIEMDFPDNFKRSRHDDWESISDWSPEKDRNAWPELFKNMGNSEMVDGQFICRFYAEVLKLKQKDMIEEWWLISAPPEQCLTALVKAIQQKGSE